MTKPRLTWHQTAPGWPLIARLGYVDIGALSQPDETIPTRWDWQFWLQPSKIRHYARSEQGAKNALTTRVAEWLRDAGLEQVKGAGE